MNLQNMPLSELAIWANKIEAHIVDLQQISKTLMLVKAKNKFYDGDSKRVNKIKLKLEELAKKLNDIYSELDRRSQESLGIAFEVEKFTALSAEIDGQYLKEKHKAEEQAKKAAKEAEKLLQGEEGPLKIVEKNEKKKISHVVSKRT